MRRVDMKLFLGVLLIILRDSESAGSKYPIYGDIFPCDESLCPYCCIKYPEYEHPVCSNDILRCKLKKLGNYYDITLLAFVVSVVWVGLPLVMSILRWLLFRKIYGGCSFFGVGLNWFRFGMYVILNFKLPPKSFYKRGTLASQQTLATQPHQKTSSGIQITGKENPLAKQGTGKAMGGKSPVRSDTKRKRTKKKSVLFQEDSSSEDEVGYKPHNNITDDSDFFAHLSDGLSDDSDYPPEAYAFIPRNGARPTKFGHPGFPNNDRRVLGVLHEEVVMEDDDQT